MNVEVIALIFNCKVFDELTTRELYEIVRARAEVFLIEQGIICRDFDGVDYNSLHCFLDDGGRIAAYLRAFIADDDSIRIGRVLSIPHGVGLGKRLMTESLPKILDHFGDKDIVIHAQCHAKIFYEKLGFYETSPEFFEEGVPHVEMKYSTQAQIDR